MTNKQKRHLRAILIAAAFFIAAVLVPERPAVNGFSLSYILSSALFIVSYFIIGLPVLRTAIYNIRNGEVFDENFLMAIATIGAFLLGEFAEGVEVMLFYQVGELFQSYAVGKSRRSITQLMDIRPDFANVMQNGTLVKVDPGEVQPGTHITVLPGERIPLDGTVVDGTSALDTAALTGEAAPREVAPGTEVLNGCINLNGTLTIEVSRVYAESTVAKILDLVENASSKKAPIENFITKFARYYTPAVVITAAVLAVVPPLVLPGATFQTWVYRALTFLVISCPCALVISVPLGFFGGIGGASGAGILVKGSNYLEALAKVRTAVFDKTGTLTMGSFSVTAINPAAGHSEDELLSLAAHAEGYTTHPIGLSLRSAYTAHFEKGIDLDNVTATLETAGRGVQASVNGQKVFAGNALYMAALGHAPFETPIGTAVHLALEDEYIGYIIIADTLKPDAQGAIKTLKQAGIKTVMLTGDSEAAGRAVAASLGIQTAYTQLLPADKVEKVEALIAAKPAGSTLCFIGDGINDAPVLARADIGIAMGGVGSDAAIEAADIVIMTDEPSKIYTAIRIGKKTMGIVYQNIVFALGIKFLVLGLGALGFASMQAAVFADVGVSVLAILNSIRALNVKNLL